MTVSTVSALTNDSRREKYYNSAVMLLSSFKTLLAIERAVLQPVSLLSSRLSVGAVTRPVIIIISSSNPYLHVTE
jgi:hypothetical protein